MWFQLFFTSHFFINISQKRNFPDGTEKILYPDGRVETRYANGRIRMKDAKGKLLLDTQSAGGQDTLLPVPTGQNPATPWKKNNFGFFPEPLYSFVMRIASALIQNAFPFLKQNERSRAALYRCIEIFSKRNHCLCDPFSPFFLLLFDFVNLLSILDTTSASEQ